MKNMPIRLKLVTLYVLMTIFTLVLFFGALYSLKMVDQLDVGQGGQIVRYFTWGFPVYCVIYVLLTVLLGRKLAGSIAYPLQSLQQSAKSMAQGNNDVKIDYVSNDEIGAVCQDFRHLIEAVREQEQVLQAIASGDYTVRINLRSPNDTMNQAIANLLQNTSSVLSDVKEASVQVTTSSHQIAQGAQALASGSTEQAAAIQQLSASVNQILLQSEQNTKEAQDAYADTQEAGALMAQSMETMAKMTSAMHDISSASQAISRVISVIDNIAFQTNILSLNASVEAARAGAHGKGFAVVAEEVRSLASKSAAAAKETADLIQNSIERVSLGNTLVEETSQGLDAVAKLAQHNASLMNSINDASQRQSQSIAEINQGIEQISTVIQSNTATAEESAASSQQMNAQAQQLQRVVERFKLGDSGPKLPKAGEQYAFAPSMSQEVFALPPSENKYL